MKNLRILACVLAVGLGLAACTESPLLAPGAPNHDSGPTIGTGYRSDSTSVNTASSDSLEFSGPTFGTGH